MERFQIISKTPTKKTVHKQIPFLFHSVLSKYQNKGEQLSQRRYCLKPKVLRFCDESETDTESDNEISNHEDRLLGECTQFSEKDFELLNYYEQTQETPSSDILAISSEMDDPQFENWIKSKSLTKKNKKNIETKNINIEEKKKRIHQVKKKRRTVQVPLPIIKKKKMAFQNTKKKRIPNKGKDWPRTYFNKTTFNQFNVVKEILGKKQSPLHHKKNLRSKHKLIESHRGKMKSRYPQRQKKKKKLKKCKRLLKAPPLQMINIDHKNQSNSQTKKITKNKTTSFRRENSNGILFHKRLRLSERQQTQKIMTRQNIPISLEMNHRILNSPVKNRLKNNCFGKYQSQLKNSLFTYQQMYHQFLNQIEKDHLDLSNIMVVRIADIFPKTIAGTINLLGRISSSQNSRNPCNSTQHTNEKNDVNNLEIELIEIIVQYSRFNQSQIQIGDEIYINKYSLKISRKNFNYSTIYCTFIKKRPVNLVPINQFKDQKLSKNSLSILKNYQNTNIQNSLAKPKNDFINFSQSINNVTKISKIKFKNFQYGFLELLFGQTDINAQPIALFKFNETEYYILKDFRENYALISKTKLDSTLKNKFQLNQKYHFKNCTLHQEKKIIIYYNNISTISGHMPHIMGDYSYQFYHIKATPNLKINKL
ncbi:hypothetical protein M0812_12065 [Anaeramoeba flamelloides]|uniref:Uncharacterized protein n=1 Tax=Anaeramoeba flamelloides TaxID=1746091 RepID=A0AAV7ZNC1_9EUKA|nr:hypothetical protein M0812_12065 [Anaeramoeba flamelloides]